MPDETPPSAPESDPIAKLTTLLQGVATDVGTINTNLDMVIGDVKVLHRRIVDVEKTTAALDEWKRSNSDRVRKIATDTATATTSAADLEHQASLAAEIVARKTLADKVDRLDGKQDTQLAILGRLDKALGNPALRQTALTMLRVINVAGVAWLAYHAAK